MWRETLAAVLCLGGDTISIHSLRVEGDNGRLRRLSTPPISIHSLRVEGDQMFSFGSQPIKHFNPLPPCGGRRKDSVAMCYIVDISIHSLRVEGDMPCIIPAQRYRISIHSLRVEGDTMAHSKCYGIDISIHSLRVEGDG